MKQKNLPDDIESKSFDELKEILNNLVEKIEMIRKPQTF